MCFSRSWCKSFINYTRSTCILCYERTNRAIDLCKPCERELPWLQQACPRCALPLKPYTSSCEDCFVDKAGFNNFAIFSPFLYQFPIRRLITRFKFHGNFSSGYILGLLLATKMHKMYAYRKKPEIIIPVPLHSNRLKRRGFNQSLELAKIVSRDLSMPYDYGSCRRVKDTPSQNEAKSKQDRTLSFYNAFKIDQALKAKHVCLIDDMVRTGETVMALSKALYQIGVQSIDVWCCARSSIKPSR